jgi:hypothetical protein
MADRNIGRISAVITARDVNFTSELTKAKNATASFGSSFASSASRVVSGAALIAAASTAVYVGISQVSQSLERLGGAADAAAKLGLQNMPEFLQGLQYHASLVGVQADSVTSSLSKLFRTIAEANAGSKSDRDILSALGLSASGLGGLTPDKAVLRVADALDKVADSGERARLAVALFGKSGGDMVNVLRGGSSAVTGGIREAQGLGVARNATELARADAAGDAIDRTRASLDGLWNELTVSISPSIVGVANALTETIKALTNNSGTMDSLSDTVISVVSTAADVVKGIKDGLDLIGSLGPASGFSMFRGGYSLPTSFGGDSIREQYKLAKIREEVAERDRKRAEEQAAFTRKQREAEQRLGSYLEQRMAKQKAAAEELARIQEEHEAAQAAAAEALQQQNMSLAQQVMGMLGLDESGGASRSIAISGGAPTIMSGSVEEQLARFNAANVNMQSVAERQLTLTQRIDKAIQDIKNKAEQDSNVIRQILERIPAVQAY